MSEIVRITKGQPFAVFIPLVVLNADGTKESVAADTLTNISVTIKGNCGEQEIAPLTHDRFLVLNLPADLQVAVYAVSVTATLWQGRQFSLRIQRAFEVVNWDWQSNWRDYLVGDHIELNDQLFIAGYYNTDAELERLKEEYRQKIAETAEAKLAYETSKANLDALAEDLEDVAQETTSQEIRQDIADVKTAVENIDFSTLAKQGSNINATNTAILEALSHIDIDTSDVAKESTLLQKSAAIIEAISGIHIDIPDNIATKDDVTAAKQAILEALSHISPEDPYSQALAAFFGITPPVPDAVPMTQQEVEDDLDELWNLIITQ